VEVENADVDTLLVERLAYVQRAAEGNLDNEAAVAAMRAGVATVCSHVIYSPELAALCAPETLDNPYASGPAELIPVLRDDLIPGNEHPEAGGRVWGADLRTPLVHADQVRNRRG
jgi:hypothetical protein